MRVLYVTLQTMSEGQAGHTHVREIVEGLRELGHRVDVLAVRYPTDLPSTPRRLLTIASTQLRSLLRLRRYDVIYLRGHLLAGPLVRVARWRGVPVVYEVNSTLSDVGVAWPWLGPAMRPLHAEQRAHLRRVSAVVAVTPDLTAWSRALSPATRVEVVPNGANARLFRPRQERRSRDLIFFGALSEWQGIQTFLAATRDPAWPSDVGIQIAGAGRLLPVVQQAAREDPRVRYLGVLPYEEVASTVSGALASLVLKEGDFAASGLSPLKLYESVAAGVSIIVTDHPDLAAVVERFGNGRVVPSRDPHAVALAVRDVRGGAISEEALREAADWVRSSQSWQARSRQTAEILASVTAQAGAPAPRAGVRG